MTFCLFFLAVAILFASPAATSPVHIGPQPHLPHTPSSTPQTTSTTHASLIPAISTPSSLISRPTWQRTLAFTGAEEGIVLVGADDTQEFWIPLPRRLILTEARLRLPWRAYLPNYQFATLSVYLNRRIVASWPIEGTTNSGVFEIPLTTEDLRSQDLRITLHLRGTLGRNECFDERFARGFIHIISEAGIEAHYLPPQDLGSHLDALPRDIRLAIPSPATKEEMLTALSAAIIFERLGHRVAFQEGHLEEAHVAVAAHTGRFQGQNPMDSAFNALGSDGLAIVDGIILLGAGGATPAALSSLGRQLGSSIVYSVNAAQSGIGGRKFSDLGLSDRDIRVFEEASHTQSFYLRDLPAGRWPESVEIFLVGPPPQSTTPALAYLHINGVLAGVQPLRHPDGEHRLMFHLPDKAIGVSNQLRLTIQREASSEACRTQPVPILFQWRADSLFHLKETPDQATDIATFTSLHDSPKIAIASEVLTRPAPILAAATFVLRDIMRPVILYPAAYPQAAIHLGRVPVEAARLLDLRPETQTARIVGPDASLLWLEGAPTPAGMQILANGILEILPAREAFRPADGRIHREAAAAFNARGIIARADAHPRFAHLLPSGESPSAVWSSWAIWLIRLSFGLGGLVLGILAALAWKRRSIV